MVVQIVKLIWWRVVLLGTTLVTLFAGALCLSVYAYNVGSGEFRPGLPRDVFPPWTMHLSETYGYNDDVPFHMAWCLFLLFVGLFLWTLGLKREVSGRAFLIGYVLLWSGIAAYAMCLFAAGLLLHVTTLQAMVRPQNLFTIIWDYGDAVLGLLLLGLLVLAVLRLRAARLAELRD